MCQVPNRFSSQSRADIFDTRFTQLVFCCWLLWVNRFFIFTTFIVTSADVSRVYGRVRGGGVYFQKRPYCSPYSFMLFITETDLG